MGKAEVAKLADAIGLGPIGRKAVGVQVLSSAHFVRRLLVFMKYEYEKSADRLRLLFEREI